MKLPQPIDYQQAVQTPDITFIDDVLRGGKPRFNLLGAPWAATGGFALTFDITSNEMRFAVRCFHRRGNHLQERYSRIAEFVGDNANLEFLVDVAYLSEGIRVEGNPLPIVRMPWVRGTPLNAWVEDNLHNQTALRQVRHQVSDAVERMRSRSAAHGDLQHGNILVGQHHAVRLVDYDGMFLPSLRGFGAAENGHRNYQHPDRDNHYDESLDLFAAHVIDLSLAAIEREPALWKEFNTDQNLLFSADDFAAPESSELFSQVRRIPELADSTRLLMAACDAGFDSVPDVLLGSKQGKKQPRPPRSAKRRGTNLPPVLLAHYRAALVEREGDEITIVGRIAAHRTTSSRGGTPVTFLNFGDYRSGDFTLVAFGGASRELHAHFGSDLERLKDAWVSMTGFVQLYQSRWSYQATPEIEVQRARSLQVLTAQEVEDTLAACRDLPVSDVAPEEHVDDAEQEVHQSVDSGPDTAPTHRTRPGSPPAPPQRGKTRGQDRLDQQVSDLYSAPRFTRDRSDPAAAAAPRSSPRASKGQEGSRPNPATNAQSAATPPNVGRSFPASPGDSTSAPSSRRAPPPTFTPGSGGPPPSAPATPSSSARSSSPPVVPAHPGPAATKRQRKHWGKRLMEWLRRITS